VKAKRNTLRKSSTCVIESLLGVSPAQVGRLTHDPHLEVLKIDENNQPAAVDHCATWTGDNYHSTYGCLCTGGACPDLG
jgi:hypothetical protein